MARTARPQSRTGIYHVMLRGINKQKIFMDDEDRRYFVYQLQTYKAVCHYEIYAYCLMSNHVHLLIKTNDQPLGEIFKRIGVSYVLWYNGKYERVGHLFQDRYRSEIVEDERYFLTVLRYILNNPVKAGICATAEMYHYSSAGEYLQQTSGITDTDFAFGIIHKEQFAEYLHEQNDDQCMEDEPSQNKKATDREAEKLILAEFGSLHPNPGKKESRTVFANSVKRLQQKGISVRQFCKLTGISRGIIERC